MRLNEVANHSWDVRVDVDPHAEVDADSAAVLVGLLAGPVGFMLGFLPKPAELEGPVSVAVPGPGLVIDDAVTVVDQLESPTAKSTGPRKRSSGWSAADSRHPTTPNFGHRHA